MPGSSTLTTKKTRCTEQWVGPDQLGIHGEPDTAKRKTECWACKCIIWPGEWRLSYAFNCGKLHRYIHPHCAALAMEQQKKVKLTAKTLPSDQVERQSIAALKRMRASYTNQTEMLTHVSVACVRMGIS